MIECMSRILHNYEKGFSFDGERKLRLREIKELVQAHPPRKFY